MEKLLELLDLRNAYLYHSDRFVFSKKYLKQRLKEINKEIEQEKRKLQCQTNHK